MRSDVSSPEPRDGVTAIVAEDLSKHYQLGQLHSLQQTVARLRRRSTIAEVPSIEALRSVSFTVAHGESFGIVGTNGSGKSTVLQILAGTIVPTGGSLAVQGRVLPLLAVGTGFHPELTGEENVTLFASSLGVPRAAISERLGAVAEFAEIERHMDTPVKRFSSGMLSRLSFAIAMQFPADIYVFDEVLAVVDGDFQARCLAEIAGLHAAGRTVIFVSHSLDQVAEVCERVMWLESGEIKQIGSAEQVVNAYSRVHASATE
jgi:ABC-type polysaccharide/polyol phosphate transport system ATPase subunit